MPSLKRFNLLSKLLSSLVVQDGRPAARRCAGSETSGNFRWLPSKDVLVPCLRVVNLPQEYQLQVLGFCCIVLCFCLSTFIRKFQLQVSLHINILYSQHRLRAQGCCENFYYIYRLALSK